MLDYIKVLFATAMHDRKGITAMEYGILAAAVLAAVAAAATTLSGKISGLFTGFESSL